jgi:ABC-type dipeptide/oligopeptide/nickel transport system permease component
MAIMFISAVLVVLSNLLADILYAALDPRIRFE